MVQFIVAVGVGGLLGFRCRAVGFAIVGVAGIIVVLVSAVAAGAALLAVVSSVFNFVAGYGLGLILALAVQWQFGRNDPPR